jgi:hypothetical protein
MFRNMPGLNVSKSLVAVAVPVGAGLGTVSLNHLRPFRYGGGLRI